MAARAIDTLLFCGVLFASLSLGLGLGLGLRLGLSLYLSVSRTNAPRRSCRLCAALSTPSCSRRGAVARRTWVLGRRRAGHPAQFGHVLAGFPNTPRRGKLPRARPRGVLQRFLLWRPPTGPNCLGVHPHNVVAKTALSLLQLLDVDCFVQSTAATSSPWSCSAWPRGTTGPTAWSFHGF